MSRRIHGLFVPLLFPAGIAAGEGGDYNTLTIARNGQRQPVLRGTALAGALRHARQRHLRSEGQSAAAAEEQARYFFGFAQGEGADAGGEESRLQVSDCILDLEDAPVVVRTHHLRNRHTGTVVDGALFSLEACPPGTTTTVALWLRDDNSSDAAAEFLQTLAGFFQQGITLGGKSGRGIGTVRLNGQVTSREYELTNLDGYAAWLDDHRAWRQSPVKVPAGQHVKGETAGHSAVLDVRFSLGIPRGQDVLVGDGQGFDHEIEPQRVMGADGKLYWRLPGASLRGIFRGWVARLAARSDRPVADKPERQQRVWTGELLPKHEQLRGDNLGWCFLPTEDRKQGTAASDCVVAGLFGSLFQAGRICIADAYAPCSPMAGGSQDEGFPEEQLRMHVAVDRITGGAAEGMLFENTVLTAFPDDRSPRFDVRMWVHDATEEEATWLAKTLLALDLGILRVGSSKSSGRLALVEPPRATGTWEEIFNSMKPSSPPRMFAAAANHGNSS